MRVRLVFLLFVLSLGCGDEPIPGDDVAPSDVTFEMLSEGFWVQKGVYNQFIGVDDFGQDYRNGTIYQTPISDHLQALGDGAKLLLEFDANGLLNIVATRVSNGKVGYSRYLLGGQFEEPIEYRILEYKHKERMVLDVLSEEVEYVWHDECRWKGMPADHFVSNGSATFTRDGDAIVAGKEYFFLARKNTCPIGGNIDLKMRERAQLHPDGQNGVVSFHVENSVLHINRFDNRSNEVDSAEIPISHPQVFQIRPQGDTYFLLMAFPTLQSQTGFTFTGRLKVTLGEAQALVEEMPLPELPANHELQGYRLLPDGRAIALTQIIRVGEPNLAAVLLEDGPVWNALDLTGATEEGRMLDFAKDGAVAFHPDLDGTLHAITMWSDVRGGHPRLGVADEIPALVSIKDGQAMVRALPALIGVRGLSLDISPDNDVILLGEWLGSNPPPAPASNYRVVSGNFHNGDHRPELVIGRLSGDDFTIVSGGVKGNFGINVAEEARYYGKPALAGTAFLTILHNTFTPGVGLSVNNGWSLSWFKPYEESARLRSWTLRLKDAPEGARVRVTETGEQCEDECSFSHSNGRFLSLKFETPPGYVVRGPKHCFFDRLDAGYCSVFMDPTPAYCREGVFWRECEGDEAKPESPVWEFTYEPTPALAASTIGLLHENANVRPDGSFSAEILVLNEAPLPDGTVVEGATVADPAHVLSRWNREEFVWARHVPGFKLVAHAVHAQDVVAIFEAEGGVTQQVNGVSVPSGGFARVVVDVTGQITAVRVLNAEGVQAPSFLVLSNGGVLMGGSATANSVYGNAARAVTLGVFTAQGSDPTLLWELDSPQAFSAKMIETASGGALLIGNGHLLTVSAELLLVHESVFTAMIGGTALNPLGMVLGRGLEGTYLAILADQDVQIQELVVPVSAPSIVSVRVSDSGVLDAPVVFAQAAAISGADAIRSVSAFDGKRLLITNAGSLTDEVFYMEGMEPFTLGRRADGGTFHGFTSKSLMPIEGGQLLWLTRGWSDQFRVRPYSAAGGVVFRMDGDSLETLQNVVVNPFD